MILGRVALACLLLPGLTGLAGCGGGGGGHAGAPPPRGALTPPGDSSVAATTAYVADAGYADVLRPCTYAGSATRRCSLATLPFLGMETDAVTVDDVLGRLLVSRRWMGDNFAAALAQLPGDLLPLFRSITAVVVATDVRPSYYDSATGAIYLDPDFLWLSTDERAQVPDTPDFRSEFGRDLNFVMPWRYVRDGRRLTVLLNPDGSRDPDQILEILAYLLYHELAHAADFMPPARLAGLDPSRSARAAIDAGEPLSANLVAAYPLTSQRLKNLAAVSFLGADSSAAQRALAPEDLIGEFADDGATQYYAYTTQYEDFATQFETAMMKWHFGYDKDTAIAHPSASGHSDDAILAWGQRGRVGAQHVRVRTLATGQWLYPGDLAALETFLAGQPPAQPLAPGQSWGASLTAAETARTLADAAAGIDRRTPDYFLERRAIH